jgi:hypothetical protein
MKKLFVSLCLMSLTSCYFLIADKMQANANAQIDTAYTQQVSQSRENYKTTKTAQSAIAFAVSVESVYKSGSVSRGQVKGPELIVEACGYLDEAAVAYPPQAAMLMAQKGPLYLAAGERETAQLRLEDSMAIKPTTYAAQYLLPIYGEKNSLDQVADTCRKTRPNVADDQSKYMLLDLCIKHTKAKTVETGLAWAPKGDVEFYNKQTAIYEAQAAQRAEEKRREEEARYAAMNSNNNSSSNNNFNNSGNNNAPATPSTVSITLRSSCSQTVRVFFGQKPKFGSGTYSSVSSNSVSSYSMKPGDMIWIVDQSDNGLSSVTISSGTREVKINSNCTSIGG